MKRDEIKRAFDAIQPSEAQKERIFNKILSYNDKNRKVDFMRLFRPKMIAAALALIVFVAGGVFTYNNFINLPTNSPAEGKEFTAGDIANNDDGREDLLAPIVDQFKIDDKNYFLLYDELKSAFNLPQTIKQEDIGDKITTITSSVDNSLIGCEVYQYIPAGCEAVVAVKKNNEYRLFKFLSFDSYNNNKDEDADAYLKLYGINSADDIAKILFIGHSEEAKLNGVSDIRAEVTDKADIAKFYDFYSVIKDSSEKYFEKLYGYRNSFNDKSDYDVSVDIPADQLPPDYAEGGDKPVTTPYHDRAESAEDSIIQYGESPVIDQGQTSPSSGSSAGALANSVTIRIYNQSGVYYEVEYYPNFGFISRHEVNSEFADFLANFIK